MLHKVNQIEILRLMRLTTILKRVSVIATQVLVITTRASDTIILNRAWDTNDNANIENDPDGKSATYLSQNQSFYKPNLTIKF